MRRWTRIALLALGTVLGYGFAIHSMRHHYYGHDGWCGHACWGQEHGGGPSSHAPPGPPASPDQPREP